jgi:hypothetical protein
MRSADMNHFHIDKIDRLLLCLSASIVGIDRQAEGAAGTALSGCFMAALWYRRCGWSTKSAPSARSPLASDPRPQGQEPVGVQAFGPKAAIEGHAWSVGLPDPQKSRGTPLASAHGSKSREMNSLPLSTRMVLG